jgi:hypothetical protein
MFLYTTNINYKSKMWKGMKFVFFSFVVFLVLGLIVSFTPVVKAATTGTITATVTVQNVSITVTDGTVAYGTLGLNSSLGTNAAQTQTATNDGNVAEDFAIKGQDSAGWTLEAAVGANQYMNRFCIATCASPPTNYTALTTDNQTLVANVSASGTQTFDLYITTPTSSTAFTSQSVDVTVTATAH